MIIKRIIGNIIKMKYNTNIGIAVKLKWDPIPIKL